MKFFRDIVQTKPLRALWPCRWQLLALLIVLLLGRVDYAQAVPSFARQTGQPCAACHVGSFGPQLKPYGRDFKMRGYVASVEDDDRLRLAMIAMSSFTHRQIQPPRTSGRDDLNLNPVSLYYAGKLFGRTGMFANVTYDPELRQLALGKLDVRHVRETSVFGKDLLIGISLNNNPGLQDVWNSLPTFGFPFVRSGLASRPKASTLFDGKLRSRVLGGSVYLYWNDLLQLEAGVYGGLTQNMLEATGKVPASGVDRLHGLATYSRASLSQTIGSHSFQLGTFALSGNIAPRGVPTFGLANRYTDVGVDANYQFIVDPAKAGSDMLSASALLISETGSLDVNQAQRKGLRDESLQTFRANVSYSFAATLTPSVQYFRTTGPRNLIAWGTPDGSPNTDGMLYEIAYVPWGKPGSPPPIPGLNARLTLQYTDYFSFDGTRLRARSNNVTFMGLQTALAF